MMAVVARIEHRNLRGRGGAGQRQADHGRAGGADRQSGGDQEFAGRGSGEARHRVMVLGGGEERQGSRFWWGGVRACLVSARADLGTAWFRSEEHTSELQSLMRISYAVFCLKKKK